MAAEIVPFELVLEFLRNRISQRRAAHPVLRRGVLSVGVVGERDGLTEWWTIELTPEDVVLTPGAPPIELEGPLAILRASERSLSELMHGGSPADVELSGDRALLDALAQCFSPGSTPISVRIRKKAR